MSHGFEYSNTMSDAQLQRISALSSDQIQKIDLEIRCCCGSNWQKVARIVGAAMCQMAGMEGIPDIYFLSRVRVLVDLGKLESRGDLSKMRFSEVRASLR